MFDAASNFFSSPIVWGLFALVIVLAAINRGDRGFGAYKSGLVSLLGSLAAGWGGLLFGLPLLGSAMRRLVDSFTDERVQRLMDRRFAGSSDPMLRGTWKDRFAVAQEKYPKDLFPTLWIKKIPEDLKRPPIADGRLITGEPLSKLAECGVTTKHQGLAFRTGLATALVWLTLLFVVWHPALLVERAGSASLASGNPDVALVAADNALVARTLDQDHWDQASLQKAVAERKAELNAPRASESPFAVDLAKSFLNPLRLLAPLAIAFLMGVAAFRGVFRAALSAAGQDIHDGTKEQIVRYKYRVEQRQLEMASYAAQLDIATGFDRSPLIDLGRSTGTYLFRGRMDSPHKGQRMKFSLTDTKQGTIIFGGTGQNKTRGVVKPMLIQILEARRIMLDRAIELRVAHGLDAQLPARSAKSAEAAGTFQWPYGIEPTFDVYEDIVYPLDLSVYMTDGKAVFYHDMKEIAAKLGLTRDLLVIGPNPDRGEFSVDLLDGIAPQLVADIIRSVARQSGGDNSGDAFWPDMAADLIRNCAVLARAFDQTHEGLAWVDVHQGERPYSLVFIYELAMDNGPLLKQVLQALGRAEDDANLFPCIKPFYTSELKDAIRYMHERWLPMVAATKDGIAANVINILGGFGSNPTLRASFAGGAGPKQVSADQFWGRLCVTNIDTTEFGVSGRIINVFLKILFMTEAAKREKETKNERSAIEQRFFKTFPKFCEINKTIEELAPMLQDEACYTSIQRGDFDKWRLAAAKLDAELADLLIAAGVEVPLPTGDIDRDIRLKEVASATLPPTGASQAIAASQRAYFDHSTAFRESHPNLAVRRVFLSDNTHLDPRKLAARIRADKEILRQAHAADPSIKSVEDAIACAHRLYCMWKVVHTRLDGAGEGAVREQIFFIADEYQTLITVDLKEGAMSDSSFPNIARSTGTSLIIATQSFAALKQAVGDVSADNFCHQLRTKIILQVEDPATIEYIKKLSGKAMRSYVFDEKGHESYDAMLMEKRINDPFIHGIKPIEINDNDPCSAAALSGSAAMALDAGAVVSANDAVTNANPNNKPDQRFQLALRGGRGRGSHIETNIDAVIAARGQAAWRAEDLRHKQLSEGNQDTEVFREDDFTMMGRNHAYMFVQRAGKSRQDFVQLDGDGRLTF